ncbi:zinc metalloprotease HtpX [bacterium (Candidatus Howlettbacteria) CG_4_10_14_0_8_um_filter_40_9]|nr:MAG: zinc metalloprotease HtpX [bacterium (Candidatus Howlettbacteria) CG_4_10_14_0_8_um_filter_40_9]
MYRDIASNKRKTFLFMTGFLLFVIALGWVFSMALDTPGILYIAVIFSTVQAFVSYYYSDKITLAISGAKEVKKADSPELYRVVENLSITAGLPMPRVYIIEDSAPNAFATGRDPQHAVVCVTTGILQKLDKVELEGVIAHELSHVGNYDIRLMTVIVVLVGVVVLMSDFFIRISFWGGGDDDRDSGQLGIILMVLGIVLALLSPLFASLIQLAISRKREFLADANGALLTRYPEGLARALEKISVDPVPLKKANKATAHLYITNPMKEHKGTSRGWFAGLFNTHPPVEERIAKLRQMIS